MSMASLEQMTTGPVAKGPHNLSHHTSTIIQIYKYPYVVKATGATIVCDNLTDFVPVPPLQKKKRRKQLFAYFLIFGHPPVF